MACRLAVATLLVPLLVFPAAAQTARVGAHYGVNLSDGHWDDERVGAQASVHVIGPLETAGAFSLFTDWPGSSDFTGSHLQWESACEPPRVAWRLQLVSRGWSHEQTVSAGAA